jgi:hypothetical protein
VYEPGRAGPVRPVLFAINHGKSNSYMGAPWLLAAGDRLAGLGLISGLVRVGAIAAECGKPQSGTYM